MSQEDVVQIKVDKQSVGIMGLKTAMEAMTKEYSDKTDDATGGRAFEKAFQKKLYP